MTEHIISSRYRSGKKVMRTMLQAVAELIFFAPLFVTIGIYSFPPVVMIGWFIGLIVAYTLPQLLLKEGKQYKNYTRVAFILINCIILIGLLYSSFPSYLKVVSMIVCIIATAFFIHSGIRNFMYSWRGSFTSTHMTIGLIAYIALQILKVLLLTEIAQYNGLFYGCGMIALIIFLYIINERMLGEHQIVDETSRTFRMSVRINRVIITIIAVVLLAIALLRGIQQQIEAWIMKLINQLIAWFSSDKVAEVAEDIAPPPPPVVDGGDLPPGEPSLFWTYLELIIKYLAMIAIAIAVIFIIGYGARAIFKGIKKLIARLFNPYMLGAEHDDGYIDEVEELQPIAKRAKQAKRLKLKNSRLDARRWSTLSNQDKARDLYTHVVKVNIAAGYHYQASHTAKQTIEEVQVQPQVQSKLVVQETRNDGQNNDYDQLLDVYNAARYGEKAPNESTLQKLFDKFVVKK